MNEVVRSIEEASSLDSPSDAIAASASKLLPPGPVKDALSGRWLGHPLHPLLTDIPIGFWSGSLLLDLVGGKQRRKAADTLLGMGILAALPTAVSGLSDWVDTFGDERRVGFVHALANSVALTLYTASYLARKNGRRGRGVLLSLGGAAAMSAGGYLGGHLSYRLGVGVNHTRFGHPAEDWTAVMPAADLAERTPSLVETGDVKVLVYKNGPQMCAIADNCSHRGGPLHEGEVDHASRIVTCPWHASQFSLVTGEIVRGPATAPQPAYDVRITGDNVEVRPRH
ncbi:MAG: Rieske 2Fe-2S domain-containing protein [Actinomycetota bacterium]|nr:Rieske 2Fe-2S domain-containing protein [Actinomycetota bacterium]